MIERLYFFYDSRGNLVFYIPWHDPKPPYIVEAGPHEDGEDEELEGVGMPDPLGVARRVRMH